MALSATALVDLTQAKAHLRIDAAASLKISAEFVGVGTGAALAFDLDHTPIEGSLRLYVDNTLQVEGTDFTIATATITFTTAPVLNKGITANYDYAAGDDTFESYDDLLLENLIEAATKKAEDYTGRAFIQRTVTEKHFGDGTKVLKLYKQPADSITSVVRAISEVVGTGDGSTVEFTLDETPTALSVKVYVDGVLQTLTTHYTISGATITFGSAPDDGAKVTAKYTHTILAINEYTEWLHIGRLYAEDAWTANRIFTVVYTAGYGATRAATQALVPNAVAAVLMMVAYLYENRTDLVHGELVTGVGSVTYELPLYIDKSGANILLNPYRTQLI